MGENIFEEFHVFILSNGMGKSRVELFRNALLKGGATVIEENKELDLHKTTTAKWIIIYDESIIKTFENFEKAIGKKKFYTAFKNEFLKSNETNKLFNIVSTLWLTECLKTKSLIELKSYELLPPKVSKTSLEIEVENHKICETVFKRKISFQNETPFKTPNEKNSSESGSDSGSDKNNEFSTKLVNSKVWTCALSSKEQLPNLNKHITDKLEELCSIYEKIKEKYKETAYQKAILNLKRCQYSITTYEEAQQVPGVGKVMAQKIWEIIQTGSMRKLDALNSRDDLKSLKLFMNCHGIGPTVAMNFINQGFTTLDDLRTKANLTRCQKIGLKHYEDFQQRMPRSEAAEIENIFKEAAFSLNNGLIIDTCGSYRRGKATCGDIDFLITHPDGITHKKIFNRLIELLHEKNDLSFQDECDTQRKYLGVCRLPGENRLHRRVDIISVPYSEYGCALLYFTGSAHFNRSMRHLARKMGMSLSEHALKKNVIRKGVDKINMGEKLYTPREEDVFKYLNLTYRAPDERDF